MSNPSPCMHDHKLPLNENVEAATQLELDASATACIHDDTWNTSKFNWWIWNSGMLFYAIYGLGRMPPLMATPSLRILCILPLVFNALSFYTAVILRLRLAVVTRRGCQDEFHQDFNKRSLKFQCAPMLLMLAALIPCLVEILALLWVPVVIPDYLETEVVRGPIEAQVLGFISAFALSFCIYMLHSVIRLGRQRDIIPRFQATAIVSEKA